jgi:hypothetical protein
MIAERPDGHRPFGLLSLISSHEHAFNVGAGEGGGGRVNSKRGGEQSYVPVTRKLKQPVVGGGEEG